VSCTKLECIKEEYGLMPNVMAALPNIGGALCSTAQTLDDVHCWSTISNLHSKFALRPHHVSKYGRHPICGCWD